MIVRVTRERLQIAPLDRTTPALHRSVLLLKTLRPAHVRVDKSGSYSWAVTPSGPDANPKWSKPGDLATLRARLRQFEAIQDVVVWAEETTGADSSVLARQAMSHRKRPR